jgi:hypothetical protein
MKYLNTILTLLLIVAFGLLLLCSGCANSTLTLNRPIVGLCKDSNDCNTPVLKATGKAAETLATQIAHNLQTAQGRLAETMKFNAYAYLALIGVFVGGLIFWWFTRSSYGWIFPASAIAGMGLITAFAQYSTYINAGILILAGALLIWKAIEYHQERDAEALKLYALKNGTG